ncbi:MAG: methionine adenosyltransferase [FCB group bacterium]|nr:methionine adenosyltransferase [FCB group bacterium]
MKKYAAESVTYLHPDKICDQISDLLLDEYLKIDPFSRVAIETAGGHGQISLFGEVTSKGEINHEKIVKKYYKKLTGQDINVTSYITRQSSEIAQGVDKGGAGDQGIMVGYACRENKQFLPQELYLARRLLQGFNVDGKSQVVISGGKITSIVLSVQGRTRQELVKHIKKHVPDVNEKNIYANFTGSFSVGGFEADSGCTGRKIVVDAYGPRVPVGGGAFSGKDSTKVDRSAAYMARWVALKLLHKYGGQEVLVRLGYVIGKPEPLIKQAIINNRKELTFDFDCRPQAIIERFNLRKPIFLSLSRYGHFGQININTWETI